MEDASGSSSDGRFSPHHPAISPADAPSPGPPKRTLTLVEVSPSASSHVSPPRVDFIRVIATPYGPQSTSSTFDFAAFSSVPPHLRRTLTIREEYSSSEPSPPELPEAANYHHAESSHPGTDIWPADMKPAEPKSIPRSLLLGGALGTTWAALRAAWCVSDPLYKHLRPGDRLLAMSQGQGLRVATFATVFHFLSSGVGANRRSLPQIMAEAAELKVTGPQMAQIKQPYAQGTTFTYLGAVAGMIASTWKLHRSPGPRVGAVQQMVGSAAIGWFWAAAGQSSSRLVRTVASNAKVRGKDKGQQG